MNKLTIEQVVQYTHSLNILYVEDDTDLREQTKHFFTMLFSSVTTAKHGQEALEIYQSKHFDIVISDIRMPFLDGVALSKHIKEINPSQAIIITSAYDDREYLLEFINLNIKQFIQKPIDADQILTTLYEVAKYIVNERMVEEYRKALEIKNKKLQIIEKKYQTLEKILENKLVVYDDSIAKDISSLKLTKEDLDELSELEIDLKGAMSIMLLQEELSTESLHTLSTLFSSYASLVSACDLFQELAMQLQSFAKFLTYKLLIEYEQQTIITLESVIYILELFLKEIRSSHYDKSLQLLPSIYREIEHLKKLTEK